MKLSTMLLMVLLALLALPGLGQETPATMVTAYDSLADAILDLRQVEEDYVRAVLDGHSHAARAFMGRGDWQRVAAEMALFANEGDNGMGGVRKRLVEGGHHHNAAGEEAGIYAPGFVLVTKEGTQKILALSSALRQAKTDEARHEAWKGFEAASAEYLENQ